MNRETVFERVVDCWDNWAKIKDTVAYFGFRDYVKGEFGITYGGVNVESFSYQIVDRKKFMWFVLQNKARE